jgi:3-phytase
MRYFLPYLIFAIALIQACNTPVPADEDLVVEEEIHPVVITEFTPNDTDDPAIWYNARNPEASLILGTDKGDSTGGIFVFRLDGTLDTARSVRNLMRPNNIDIRYNFRHQGQLIDIAVFTERGRDMIRVLSLPDCKFIDNGGIPVFEGEEIRSPMGLALHRTPNGEIHAFVSRKSGPEKGYIFQYRLISSPEGVTAVKVRALGRFSGQKEIEAMVVDDEHGYLYYSDEGIGIRKYHASPVNGSDELALFGTTGFMEDHEGLSIAGCTSGKGFIIASDQQANAFRIFTREGYGKNPHDHRLVRIVHAQTNHSDGNEALAKPLGDNFPHGIFVAMSDDRTFHFYRLEEVLGKVTVTGHSKQK